MGLFLAVLSCRSCWLPVHCTVYTVAGMGLILAGLLFQRIYHNLAAVSATWPGFVFKPADLRSAASVTAGVHAVAVSSVDLVAAFIRSAAVYY